MPLIIDLKGITKSYVLPRHTVEVLKGIDLSVEPGEFVCIMGPSGSGKSTLLNLIGCLDRPTTGTYLLEGEDVKEKTGDQLAETRNRKIGFVFQSFNLLPRYPAWKNVELPLLYAGVAPEERRQRAEAMLNSVGLSERTSHAPSELSGGEQQRVAIARALVTSPAIILSDEPTGNLDSRSGQEIMDIFSTLHKEGATILMVTHEPHIAARAHRTITLKDGVTVNGEVSVNGTD